MRNTGKKEEKNIMKEHKKPHTYALIFVFFG
jgi:hypothetical protein